VSAHLVPLAGDFSLWRDFAVRSAGFPVSGLDAFGPGDESARLRAVAADPLFVEAVTWQNPAAVDNAVGKLVDGRARKPSRSRQHEELVASYWQRYCAKNDTIGFFGPLAWGRIEDDAPALTARSLGLERERVVHLESWGVQALAETIDPELRIPTGPHPERDLREALDAHVDETVRRRGLPLLERLVAARDAVAAAPAPSLRAALAELDATFVELTGREPVRHAGRAYGARTLSYVDCMRDLDVFVGPALVAEMRPALQTLFEACRWYCGRVQGIGRRVVEQALPDGRAPFAPVLGDVLRRLMQPPPEVGDAVAELERRLTEVLRDTDPATIGARAAAAFADHEPAWRHAVFHSADVQLAARDEAAVAAGDYLAVIGDVHPGNNPLAQGLFAHRHPDQASFWAMMSGDLGPGAPLLLPPLAPGMGVDGRGFPATSDEMIHFAVMPETRAQNGRRTWLPGELLVEDGDVVDATGELRIPAVDVFAMAIFVAGVRMFELLPDEEHAPRAAIGRVVIRRESWSIPVADVPARPQDVPAFARGLGMPRRVFAKSPLERKPMYLDVESPVLAQILCRHARRAAAEAADARFRFTEMLPGADECWLADGEGNRYVSELRLVAVDETRRARSGRP
jgi:hypothetical protein